MRKSVLAILAIGCGSVVFGSTEASAFGWGRYRPNDPAQTSCYRGLRWNFSAAYYQSYRKGRVYRRACGCRKVSR